MLKATIYIKEEPHQRRPPQRSSVSCLRIQGNTSLTPGKGDRDRDKDDDKPVDEQWWRKSLGPSLDPSRPQDALFLLGSLTPSHDDEQFPSKN